MRILTILLLPILFLVGCQQNNKSDEPLLNPGYTEKIEEYRNDLMQSRKQNYLPLVALLKMNGNELKFGKDSINELSLNVDRIPPTIGTFRLEDSLYIFKAEEGVNVILNDKIIKSINLELDEFGSSQKLEHNELKFQIITRNNTNYLRVWDELNPEIEAFKGFEHYPLNPEMIFESDFTYYDSAKTEKVKSQLGPMTGTDFIGKITFNYQGKIYSLDVGNSGFIMVADATTGEQTYGGGRYMYLDLPEKDSKVQLDFNKLYNPPCSFNEFTTCLYPPQQNNLDFAIDAGEKISLKVN